MPDFIDNCAGVTSVTGTAHYLIDPIGTGRHLRPDQVLENGQQVAYYAVYESTGTSGFESGLASWSKSLNTLEVLSVTGSSNGNAKVSWGEGNKIIHIVANSDMLDVPVVAPGDLGTPDSIDGTEKWIAVDGNGDGIDLDAQLVSGDPVRHALGLNLDYKQGYCDFSKIRDTFTSVNGELADLEPWVIYQSGTGANATNFSGFIGFPVLFCNVGTSGTGYVSAVHTDGPNAFSTAKSMKMTTRMLFNNGFSGTEGKKAQVGFINGAPALAVQGMYFERGESNNNYIAVVKNAAGSSTVDTGVPALQPNTDVGTVFYDAYALATKFYLNGVLKATITNATRVVDSTTRLWMVGQVRKSNGAAECYLTLVNHSYRIQKDRLDYF